MKVGSGPGCGPASLCAVHWLHEVDSWDCTGTGVLVLLDASPTSRRSALRALAARAVERHPDTIDVVHRDGHGPLLAVPNAGGPGRDGSGTRPTMLRRPALSSGSRGRLSVVAVSPKAVGVDVEQVEDGADIPWGALHPAEARALKRLCADERARVFARIWSVKEAYLKALRLGLSREPADIMIEPLEDGRARISDSLDSTPVVSVETVWRRAGSDLTAVSVVLLRTEQTRRPDAATPAAI